MSRKLTQAEQRSNQVELGNLKRTLWHQRLSWVLTVSESLVRAPQCQMLVAIYSGKSRNRRWPSLHKVTYVDQDRRRIWIWNRNKSWMRKVSLTYAWTFTNELLITWSTAYPLRKRWNPNPTHTLTNAKRQHQIIWTICPNWWWLRNPQKINRLCQL